jgi:transcriptional regulator with XRE-family HTH domain
MKQKPRNYNSRIIENGKTKSPSPIDIHIGQRLREQRRLQKLSQKKLASHIGVTFQQLQKYEKGRNRISAARLYAASQICGCSIIFFFETLPIEGLGEHKGSPVDTKSIK